jgi:hypothetical protein
MKSIQFSITVLGTIGLLYLGVFAVRGLSWKENVVAKKYTDATASTAKETATSSAETNPEFIKYVDKLIGIEMVIPKNWKSRGATTTMRSGYVLVIGSPDYRSNVGVVTDGAAFIIPLPTEVDSSLRDPGVFRKWHANQKDRWEIKIDNETGFVTHVEVGCGDVCIGSTSAFIVETIHKGKMFEITLLFAVSSPNVQSVLNSFVRGMRFLD